MPLTESLRDDILASVPSLRAFAISLSGNGDRADDLVQETLLRALGCLRSCATCSARTIASAGAR
jgi:RNA polymerase sigma-70 factor, ECF subfamily